MTKTHDRPILHFLGEVARLCAQVPFLSLDPGEDHRLSGYLFPRAMLFLDALVYVLGSRPELFPGHEQDEPGLRRDLAEAADWDMLVELLEALLQRAKEARLAHQGRLVRSGLKLMERFDLEDRLWLIAVTDEERRDPQWRLGELARWGRRQVALLGVRRFLLQRRPGGGKGKKHHKPGSLARAAARTLVARIFSAGLKRPGIEET